jgi:antitoxin CcdA
MTLSPLRHTGWEPPFFTLVAGSDGFATIPFRYGNHRGPMPRGPRDSTLGRPPAPGPVPTNGCRLSVVSQLSHYQKSWRSTLDRDYPAGVSKIRDTRPANTARPETPAEAARSLMTAIAPAGDGLSDRDRRWRRENRSAIDAYNEWIAEHGLPLEEIRRF